MIYQIIVWAWLIGAAVALITSFDDFIIEWKLSNGFFNFMKKASVIAVIILMSWPLILLSKI